jgi:GNAT superfamily N-acetyltransferase
MRPPARLHQGYLPGCIGRIAELHARFYAQAVGFGLPFEAKVASELAAFCSRLDPEADGLWLALQGESVEGAIAIDAVQQATSGAHLRWFITSDATRGSGVGSQLLEAAMAFCRARAYPRVYLWTFDGLQAARHLYEKQGFRLAHSERGAQWGKEVNEQMFVLERVSPGSTGGS